VKESCKHSGGILAPDECIMNFVGKKNEHKLFVCTNDEVLRNELRNTGVVPIFFFRKGTVLIMD
jgi:rRNA-processing protein FCF1